MKIQKLAIALSFVLFTSSAFAYGSHESADYSGSIFKEYYELYDNTVGFLSDNAWVIGGATVGFVAFLLFPKNFNSGAEADTAKKVVTATRAVASAAVSAATASAARVTRSGLVYNKDE